MIYINIYKVKSGFGRRTLTLGPSYITSRFILVCCFAHKCIHPLVSNGLFFYILLQQRCLAIASALS